MQTSGTWCCTACTSKNNSVAFNSLLVVTLAHVVLTAATNMEYRVHPTKYAYAWPSVELCWDWCDQVKFYPYPPRLLYWYLVNHMLAPMPLTQTWLNHNKNKAQEMMGVFGLASVTAVLAIFQHIVRVAFTLACRCPVGTVAVVVSAICMII